MYPSFFQGVVLYFVQFQLRAFDVFFNPGNVSLLPSTQKNLEHHAIIVTVSSGNMLVVASSDGFCFVLDLKGSKLISFASKIGPSLAVSSLSKELEMQDIVFVTFTVNSNDWEESENEARQNLILKSPHKMREGGYTKALSFNVLDIVLLYREEPVEDVGEYEDDESAGEEHVF
ncbi:hypothetical protein M422DRAFT_261565 [Sphaerobolus stellatus SS14]|uniref:Uncharacterized protein n=1 Tax=Sphaerobolus stellatus (strain SS14) TaxID=990650 RepID=A0A0C9V2U8_SPHS4|nr:hypothetical protein M422DRAFT_261565 [Sphaerobolus stellatus SS14]